MLTSAELDATFAALADPTRRSLLQRLLSNGPASATTLAEPMTVSRQAISTAKRRLIGRTAGSATPCHALQQRAGTPSFAGSRTGSWGVVFPIRRRNAGHADLAACRSHVFLRFARCTNYTLPSPCVRRPINRKAPRRKVIPTQESRRGCSRPWSGSESSGSNSSRAESQHLLWALAGTGSQ